MILRGMGELHLDIKIDILKRTHKVEVEVGAPQVAYRETITKPVTDSYTHKKQSGGSGQFAKIDYTIEPAKSAQASSSSPASSVVTFLRNTSPPSKKASRHPSTKAHSPVTLAWTSKSPSQTVASTQLTPPPSPSRSLRKPLTASPW